MIRFRVSVTTLFLFFLFLKNPSSQAQEGYINDGKNGCKSYTSNTRNRRNQWFGECYNSAYISGNGILKVYDHDTLLYTYAGELRTGKFNGYGAITYKSGEIYAGMWSDHDKYGKGTKIYLNGSFYTGEFKKDFLDGNGSFNYSNGDVYSGGFVKDKRNGKGSLSLKNGAKYEGDWKEDRKEGFGRENYLNKDRYEGNFKSNSREGIGTYTYANGDKYVGDWKNNNRHGQGTLTDKNGKTEAGFWYQDKYRGATIDDLLQGTEVASTTPKTIVEPVATTTYDTQTPQNQPTTTKSVPKVKSCKISIEENGTEQSGYTVKNGIIKIYENGKYSKATYFILTTKNTGNANWISLKNSDIKFGGVSFSFDDVVGKLHDECKCETETPIVFENVD
jgi:hypothetical protein